MGFMRMDFLRKLLRSAGLGAVVAVAEIAASDLAAPDKKDLAMKLLASAENSSLRWQAQYGYIEDIGDGRGYTGGIVGFCSGTGDLLQVVEAYCLVAPRNSLAKYRPALRKVLGTASHAGLDPTFVADWKVASRDPRFRRVQDTERDRLYFGPALRHAKADGLGVLGQFIYFDAAVMHGFGSSGWTFERIRQTALVKAATPSGGGDEVTYLHAFLDARRVAMQAEAAHADTSRVDTAQRTFLQAGNLNLALPLEWVIYGDRYRVPR